MYDSYDYNKETNEEANEEANEEVKQLSIEELKAREKAIKAEQKAQKKAQKAKRKAERKAKGTGKRVFGTIGLAMLFGVVAAGTFRFSNGIIDRFAPNKAKNVQNEVAVAEGESKDVQNNDVAKPNESAPEKKVENVKPLSKEIKEPGMIGDVTSVVEDTMPSIVAITNKSVQEVMSWYGMGIQQYESESAGSGIIIGQNDTELLVVTNAHVVEGAQTLSVCFIDESAYEAVIKGTDASNDLAVIAVDLNDIDGKTLEQIKVATIGDSETLKIGEQVIAIGNALGYGQSVTTGIVSALDRDITDDDVDNSYIQTDAAINPGNSGGALLNLKGELVGINSAKLANTKIEGMGYAIPISAAMPIVDNLMSRVSRTLVSEDEAGYLGISGFSVTKDVSKQYGIPEGIYISEVTPGAAADKAGLQKGDIITEFDGLSVDSIAKLRERLDYYKAGEEIDVKLYRTDNGQYAEKTFKVVLDSRKGTPLDKNAESDSDEVEENTDEDVEEEPEYNFRDFYGPEEGYRSIFDFFGY